jgi:hypothetical protein
MCVHTNAIADSYTIAERRSRSNGGVPGVVMNPTLSSRGLHFWRTYLERVASCYLGSQYQATLVLAPEQRQKFIRKIVLLSGE